MAAAEAMAGAVRELLALKTLKKQIEESMLGPGPKHFETAEAMHVALEDYERRKPLAWAAAQEALEAFDRGRTE